MRKMTTTLLAVVSDSGYEAMKRIGRAEKKRGVKATSATRNRPPAAKYKERGF
jgi:hypothetical protein